MSYGVSKLATDLKIKPASVRVALRKAKVKPPYEWDAKKYSAIKKQLSDKSRKPAKKKAKKKAATKKAPAAEAAAS